MKHTPGPWEVSRGAQSDAYSVEAAMQTICNVKFIKGQELSKAGVKQEESNARLIAAAPELLAACKATIAEFKQLGQAMGEYTPPETVDVWNLVEAAIKKAEGT